MDLRTLLAEYDELLATYSDADGTKVVVSGSASSSGDTGSSSIRLVASVDGQGSTTASVTAEAEVDGTKVSATGDAAASGDEASTTVDASVSVDDQGAETVAVGSAEAEATAEAEDGSATADVSTDAEITQDGEVVAEDHDADSETGDTPTASAESFVSVEPLQFDAAEGEVLELTIEDDGIAQWWADLEWWF